jgi:hypothetical protein
MPPKKRKSDAIDGKIASVGQAKKTTADSRPTVCLELFLAA